MTAVDLSENPAGSCPLCGTTKHMPKAKPLYWHAVCKKCYYRFVNRRQLAFAIDSVIWSIVSYAFLAMSGGVRTENGLSPLFWWLFLGLFFMKDGFSGFSPGKALLGLRVINEKTGNPIGIWSSFKRNLPLLIPLMPLVVAIELYIYKGHRTGDK